MAEAMTTGKIRASEPSDAFRHEAIFYGGPEDFVERTAPFIRDAVDADEPILVVVSSEKIEMLRSGLGSVDRVRFADMAEVGRNPARIIPVWHEFVDEQRGLRTPVPRHRGADLGGTQPGRARRVRATRGAGQPRLRAQPRVAAGLSLRHGVPGPAVIEEAKRNHPFVSDGGERRRSPVFRSLAEVARPFDRPLPEPRGVQDEITFDVRDLHGVRSFVARAAGGWVGDPARIQDFVLAAHEIASNSVRHGGGRGVIRLWPDGNTLICEIRDGGHMHQPLAGRTRPVAGQASGFGLWLANQLCDLVQVRSFPTGSVVRLHLSRGHA